MYSFKLNEENFIQASSWYRISDLHSIAFLKQKMNDIHKYHARNIELSDIPAKYSNTICNTLAAKNNVKKLKLSFCEQWPLYLDKNEEVHNTISNLLETATKKTSLQTMILETSKDRLTLEHMHTLANIITYNNNLSYLRLQQINRYHLKELLIGLKAHNVGLRVLNLANNQLDDNIITLIEAFVARCHKLEAIDLSYNNISYSGIMDLKEITKKIPGLSIHLKNNLLSEMVCCNDIS